GQACAAASAGELGLVLAQPASVGGDAGVNGAGGACRVRAVVAGPVLERGCRACADGSGQEAAACAGGRLFGEGLVSGRRVERPGERVAGGGPAGLCRRGESVGAREFVRGGKEWATVVASPRLPC